MKTDYFNEGNKNTPQCMSHTGHSLHLRYTLRKQTNRANQVKDFISYKAVWFTHNFAVSCFKSDALDALEKLLTHIYLFNIY